MMMAPAGWPPQQRRQPSAELGNSRRSSAGFADIGQKADARPAFGGGRL